ncbi:MAG: poly-gamma-glutamate biosynthesis protein PgsC/CapC [Pseudomonadota bacterium]
MITTVWVGVFVISFFNLRFGWVLSGLVVPGYLAPLIIARPWSAMVIMIEASVTYFLVWLFSEKLSGARTWSSVFGRDRFMALVLVSIAVRLCFDGWLLPSVADWLEARYDVGFDWRSNLHSFGLIIISLFANQLWKPGYVRGMANSLVIVGLSTLIIRYGLMEFTNFRISSVSYLYEGVASSILASPKAYIILVMTAILSSRMNLKYGWEFNGILIPALIALQWYQPFRILTSFVEALVIYGLAGMLLRTRFFADVTMEGARKVLLFFNISFGYRIVLGHALTASGFEVQIVDYYGFGYLLSTLIAIKMFDKNIAARLSRATLQISFAGAAVGSLIGFALTLAMPSGGGAFAARPGGDGGVQARRGSLATLVAEETMDAHGRFDLARTPPPTQAERAAFRAAVELLAEGATPEEAAPRFASVGYQILRLSGDRIALVESRRRRGRGAFVLRQQGSPVSLVVRNPLAAPGLTGVAARLFDLQNARALAIGGANLDRLPRKNRAEHSFLESFLAAMDQPRLELRAGQARTSIATLPGRSGTALNLAALERVTGDLRIQFTGMGDTGSLVLTSGDVQRLIADPGAIMRRAGPIDQAIADARGDQPAAGKPSLGELAFLDAEVLRPLFASDAPARIAAAAAMARSAGYQLTLIGQAGNLGHVMLAPNRSSREGRGVYVIRLGAAEPILVQAPRAADYPAGTERAVRLYNALNARTLMIAQTDLVRGGTTGLFDAVYQAALRASEDEPLLVLQIRAMPTRPDGTRPSVEALIASAHIGAPLAAGQRLADALRAAGLSVGYVTGGADTAGYEVGALPQAVQLAGTRNKSFAVVWLAPNRRAAAPVAIASREALYKELGIPTVNRSLTAYRRLHSPGALPPPALRARLADFAARRDAVALRQAQTGFPGYRLEQVSDPERGSSVLAVLGPGGRLAALFDPSAEPGTALVAPGLEAQR